MVTNGVTTPNLKVLDSLKNPRVVVIFSEYSTYLNKNKKILQRFDDENIDYLIISMDDWADFDNFDYMQRSNSEKLDLLQKCGTSSCNYLLIGNIYCCPRASHGHDLGIYNFSDKNSCINLREDCSIEQLRENIIDFYRKPYFKECD